MRPKSYSFKRTPRFETEDLNFQNSISDHAHVRTTKQRIARIGPLSVAQYKQIWNWEFPAFGGGIGAYVVQWTQGKLSADIDKKWFGNVQNLPNFKETLGAMVLHGKNRDLNRIFHNLSNINGILYFMKAMGAKPSEVLFDGETNIEMVHDKYLGDKFLRPDGVIMKNERIVFLETDMGTHEYKTLRAKSELYKNLIESGTLQSMGFTDIVVVIHSYSKRIQYVRESGVMDPIAGHVQYLDFLDNEFHYMTQSGPGALSYPWSYKGLDRAIRKLRKLWVEEVVSQGKDPEKEFRNPATLYDHVMRLRGILDESDDDTDIAGPTLADLVREKELRDREMAADQWVWNRSRAT